ncbi:MAG: HRDC domain-containing protein, partial [Gemmatimonadetes bacterium]|nr:HRDC domain-containing protein [Gemmatimonadota bacterium]
LGSALRLLADHGVVRQLSAGAPPVPHVRLTATPERIRRDLDAQERGAELHFLRSLWRLGGGERVYRGAELSWRELAHAAGGRADAQQLLDSLQREGFLAWQDASAGEGIQVLNHKTPFNRLPIEWRAIDARKHGDENKLQRMQGYAYQERCRRGYLLRYFGDPAAMDECGACDNCLQAAPESTGSRKLSLAPAGADPPKSGRAERRVSQDPVNRGLAGPALALYEQLRRIRAEVAARAGLPAYFVLTDAALRELAERSPLTPEEMLDVRGIGAKTLEKYGLPFLNALREHAGESPAVEASMPAHSTTRTASPSTETRRPPSEAESALYAELRSLRGEIARGESVPAYCVFPDKTLIELARLRPRSEAAFLDVPGVGPTKLEKYSERFLRVLRGDGAT